MNGAIGIDQRITLTERSIDVGLTAYQAKVRRQHANDRVIDPPAA